MKEQIFVAETDEYGAVACVWVSDPSARGARIFDRRLHQAKLDMAECFGAPKHQIAAWLASEQVNGESKHD